MTTYLTTVFREGSDGYEETETTYAFCSGQCREAFILSEIRRRDETVESHRSNSYEFNETCSWCGALVLANPDGRDPLTVAEEYAQARRDGGL